MSLKRGTIEPLKVFEPDDKTIIAVYQGNISEFDILIRYRQKLSDGKWSRIRTPKHIHWAIDLLIKIHRKREKIKSFLSFLINIWNETTPINTEAERKAALNINNLLKRHQDKIKEYEDISNIGEYRIEFLNSFSKTFNDSRKDK